MLIVLTLRSLLCNVHIGEEEEADMIRQLRAVAERLHLSCSTCSPTILTNRE